jgi:hypothetical protein
VFDNGGMNPLAALGAMAAPAGAACVGVRRTPSGGSRSGEPCDVAAERRRGLGTRGPVRLLRRPSITVLSPTFMINTPKSEDVGIYVTIR